MEIKNNPLIEHIPTNEYLLILSPDNSVNEKIKKQKELFAEKMKCPSCLHSKPHITLINFVQYSSMENIFLKRFFNYAYTVSPFIISLSNFGSFPSHTIFFNIETKNNIVELVKNIRDLKLPIRKDKDNTPHYITEPHLTFARRLLPWQYEQGWLEWSNQNFSAKFMVNKMTLLRRKDNSSPCVKIAEIPFKGIKNKVQQSLLF